VNLNRLFPRLSITAKLAIAFVMSALVPLVLVSIMGTFFTVQQMRERERDLLEHDLETVGQQTAGSLGELVRQVGYIADLGLADRVLGEAQGPDFEAAVTTYMVADSSALFRVKAVDSRGDVVVEVRRPGHGELGPTEAIQPFYLWLASELDHGETRLVPVELRSGQRADLIPAVAVVRAVRDAAGGVRGAVVGEASAAEIFTEIDHASPDLEGVTALVDAEGRFLYHTLRKRDWATLLARRNEVSVANDVPVSVASAILSGEVGTIRTKEGVVVTYRPLRVPGLSISPFGLYRTFSQSMLGGSVRRFLAAVGLTALFIVFSVLGVAVVAARQITRPLYLLQKAARQVTGGTHLTSPLSIETNDEIQDLAEDFEHMADEVDRHRRRLESAVEERTRELRRTEAELSRIVSLSADGIVGLDSAGRIRLWNRGAERLMGFSSEEAQGRDLDDLILPEGPRGRREQAYLRQALQSSGAVIAYQTTRRAKSGEMVPVGITQTVLKNEEGQATGSSVILRDARLQEQVQEQMRRSERLSAMSVMAAGLAHELNNPVAVLDNRLELMQREASRSGMDDRLRQDVAVLRDQVGRLGEITGDLLRFARDETDEMTPLEVNDVVVRVTRLLDRILAAEGVGLEHSLANDLPRVLASTTAVETILVNLVLNAQQACRPEGMVTIATRSSDASGRVEVQVRDTGPGVPDEFRNRIFEPFFTTKGDRGGTGLGLAVCRALMERHGGTIHLARGNGDGAVFVLGFPVLSGQNDE